MMTPRKDLENTRAQCIALYNIFKAELSKLPKQLSTLSLQCTKRNGSYAFYALQQPDIPQQTGALQQSASSPQKPQTAQTMQAANTPQAPQATEPNHARPKRYYLNKKQKPLIDELRYKKGLEIGLAILEQNIYRLDRALCDNNKRPDRGYKTFNIFDIDELLPQNFLLDGWSFSAYSTKRNLFSDLLSVSISKNASYNKELVDKWLSTSLYPEKKQGALEYHKESLNCDTGLGFNVRNKSEMLIAVTLHSSEVPSKFEEPLLLYSGSDSDNPFAFRELNDPNQRISLPESSPSGPTKFLLPDFTILMPNGEIVIWEHAGRMDLEEYRNSYFAKLNTYVRNGFYPGKNLYFTYEDSSHPLDIETIKQTISHIFRDYR